MEKSVSKSLSFGLQNFLWTNSYVGSNVTGDDKEYSVYVDNRGLVLIAQYNIDGNEARYCTKAGDYSTIVDNRGNYTYLLPSKIKEIQSEFVR